jgi:hypothetical protein
MVENLLTTSIFVKILFFAFISVLSINIVVGLVNVAISLYARYKRIKL